MLPGFLISIAIILMFISLILFDIAKNSFTGMISDGEKDCLKLTYDFVKYAIDNGWLSDDSNKFLTYVIGNKEIDFKEIENPKRLKEIENPKIKESKEIEK